MKRARRFLTRLATLVSGRHQEDRLRAEIEEHVALQSEENIRSGMSPTEARRQALLKFGAVEPMKEAYRDQESIPFLENLLLDLKYALRMLRKSPAFALAAIFVLALGIGANTAVFSLVDAVLLRPLPFPHSERLMVVGIIDPKEPLDWELGDADFLAVRAQEKSFSSVAAWALGQSEFSFRAGNSEPQRVRGVAVTAGFFDTLGIRPELGRNFQPSDDRAEAPPVVMVSHEFWQTQLGGDRNIVGQTVNINGRPRTVAGVMRAGLKFPSNETVDIWTLNVIETSHGRPPYYLRVFGRLKPGVSREQAAQELSAIGRSVQQQYPNSIAWMGQLAPLKERMTNSVRSTLWVMLGAVLLVLLIAIANVANLLLARSTVRQREIAVRLALGASRGRIVLQLVTESVLLSAIGGVFGILLAFLAQQAFLRAGDVAKLPLAYQVTIDMRLLLFTCVVSGLAGVIFGLAPAMQVRGPLAPKFQEGTRSTAGAGKNMRRTLVAAEFAIALVLVAGAALLIRSFIRLNEVNPGFNADHLVTARIALPYALYRDDKAIVRFWDDFLRRVNVVPGVRSAAVTMALPPNLLRLTNPFTTDLQPFDKSRPTQLAEEGTISPGYFATLGVPLLAGRDFQPADSGSKLDPIIINRTAADKYFPGQDPIGHKLQTGEPRPEPPSETIIGIVGDVKYSGLDAAPSPQFYKLYSGGWAGFSYSMFLVVRTDSDPSSVIAGLRNQLSAMDPNLPLADVATMRERLGQSVGEQRFRTLLLGAFAGLALLLASFGIYAVTAYFVEQRTREIGIRVALGATRGDVVKLVLSQALTMSFLGVAFGVAGALILTRAIRSLLFAVSPSDPFSFAATVALLIAVAMLASYVPAMRATKVDPLVALRYE